MSGQQVLAVTPVALFELVNGQTTEKGNCACALVGFPANPPKYSMVCYNDKRETLCVATITASIEHSLQLAFSTNDYATFSDDRARKWSLMFIKSSEVPKFVAALGAVLFGAANSPSHHAVIGDLASGAASGARRLDLSQRCKVHYHAFALNRSGALPLVDRLLETNGDRAYNFHPVQSAGAMDPDAKGFESSVIGMREEGRRVVVVPPTMHRAGRSPYPEHIAVVFVIELVRIVPDGDGGSSGGVLDVPQVYGQLGPPASSFNGHSGGSSSALVVAGTPLSARSGSTASAGVNLDERGQASPVAKGAAGGVGSGIPAEHMGMIQNAAAKINNATTSARDLHDKIVSFQDDWKQVVNRPKPSALTNEALEQSVKSLVMDHDRLRDEIARRDELIRSLDERNRDLQKRVDRAAMVAQQLLDEKQQTASQGSDSRLEKDRHAMKLQEQITREASERDDIQRHLVTVKKLLEVSDGELRDVKGKAEVLKVQAASIAGKLDALEDQLSEERSRRKALEAKAAALQDEIRDAETEVHMKSAEHEEVLRKADAERMHYAQLMEDERQRRAFEAQQLRAEIVSELQQREDKFQADRARVAEDNFARGHDEGKEIGRRNARIDVEARLQELQLEAQRAKTALDAYKTELREKNDEAMTENRRLDAIVSSLKASAEEAARAKASNEYKLHSLQARARNAEDALFLAFNNAAHRLTRPATAEDLIHVLEQLRDGAAPKFDFLAEQHALEEEAARAARVAWVTADLEALYEEHLAAALATEFTDPLGVALEETKAAVRELWAARDRAMFGSIFDEEVAQRDGVVDAEAVEFALIEELLQSHVAAQQAIAEEEDAARAEIAADEAPFAAWLAEFLAHAQQERAAVEQEVDEVVAAACEEEADAFREIIAAFEAVVFEKLIDEQQVVISEEAAARSALEAEADSVRSEEIVAYVDASREEAQAKQVAREAEEARLAAERAVRLQQLEENEAAARGAAADAEEGERGAIAAEEGATRPRAPAPRPTTHGETMADDEDDAEESSSGAFVSDPLAAPAASSTAAPEGGNRVPSQRQSLLPRSDSASDDDGPLGAAAARPAAKGGPAPKRAAAAASMFSDDSDDGAAAPRRASPAAAARPAAGPRGTGKEAAASLFADDSDSDAPPAAPSTRPAPKRVAPKSSAPAKLFESDSDS